MDAIKQMVELREEIRTIGDRIRDMEGELADVMGRLTIAPPVISQVTMQCRVYRAGGRKLGEALDRIMVAEMLAIVGMDGKDFREDNDGGLDG